MSQRKKLKTTVTVTPGLLGNANLLGEVATFLDHKSFVTFSSVSRFFNTVAAGACNKLNKITPSANLTHIHYLANIINEREPFPKEFWLREVVWQKMEKYKDDLEKLKNYNFFIAKHATDINKRLKHCELALDPPPSLNHSPDYRVWSVLTNMVEPNGTNNPAYAEKIKNLLIKISLVDLSKEISGKLFFAIGILSTGEEREVYLQKAQKNDCAAAYLVEISDRYLNYLSNKNGYNKKQFIKDFTANWIKAIELKHPAACFITWRVLDAIESNVWDYERDLLCRISFHSFQAHLCSGMGIEKYLIREIIPQLAASKIYSKKTFFDASVEQNYPASLEILAEQFALQGDLERLLENLIKQLHLYQCTRKEVWVNRPKDLIEALYRIGREYEGGGNFTIEMRFIPVEKAYDSKFSFNIEKNTDRALQCFHLIFEKIMGFDKSYCQHVFRYEVYYDFPKYLLALPTLLNKLGKSESAAPLFEKAKTLLIKADCFPALREVEELQNQSSSTSSLQP